MCTPMSSWISVDDRLPEIDTASGKIAVAVIAHEPGRGVVNAYYAGGHFRLSMNGHIHLDETTHWMYLPPAPVVKKMDCVVCGTEFVYKRKTRKTCGDACRARLHRANA